MESTAPEEVFHLKFSGIPYISNLFHFKYTEVSIYCILCLKTPYYALIIPNAFSNQLCSILCPHNVHRPNCRCPLGGGVEYYTGAPTIAHASAYLPLHASRLLTPLDIYTQDPMFILTSRYPVPSLSSPPSEQLPLPTTPTLVSGC